MSLGGVRFLIIACLVLCASCAERSIGGPGSNTSNSNVNRNTNANANTNINSNMNVNGNYPVCGNGVVELVEECDDGTWNSDFESDACRTDCRLAYCGDAVTDTGEMCDDGNTEPLDGCTPDCQEESWCGDGSCDAGIGEDCGTCPDDCCCQVSGIVGWWPGEGDADDIIGGLDGISSNGATYALGLVGQGFLFDGLDDEVVVDGAYSVALQSFTIEAWVWHQTLPPQIQRYVTLGGADAGASLRYDGINGAGQLHFFMGPWTTLQHVRASGVLQPAVWYHVAATYDGNLMRAYLDGAEMGSAAIAGVVLHVNHIFFSSSGEALDGMLDEITLYDRALMGTEILEIYLAGSTGKCMTTDW